MMSRFLKYINKVFKFGEAVMSLTDRRKKPRIPAASVFMSAFWMFAMRLGSLNAVEGQLRVPKRLDKIIGKKKPSADRIGDVYCLLETDFLRRMLRGIAGRLKRNKVFTGGPPLLFAAVDGHEFFSQ